MKLTRVQITKQNLNNLKRKNCNKIEEKISIILQYYMFIVK